MSSKRPLPQKACNCLSYWFPILLHGGIPVPRTEVIEPDCQLIDLMDGKEPKGFKAFLGKLRAACKRFGLPVFLRTGMGSGKHNWKNCCYLDDLDKLGQHVFNLVEWSECVDFMGLPYNVWAVREFLPLKTAFALPRYGGMPVAREFRGFVAGGKVQCVHSYWPTDAVEQGFEVYGAGLLGEVKRTPPRANWKADLARISSLGKDGPDVRRLLGKVAKLLDGGWSVDCCQLRDGRWFVTDCAEAERSFHWPDCPVAKKMGWQK